MKLHELAAKLKRFPGMRLRVSEFAAYEITPEGELKRFWTPPLTDAQVLAYWGRGVIRVERPEDGAEVYAIITGKDGENTEEPGGLEWLEGA